MTHWRADKLLMEFARNSPSLVPGKYVFRRYFTRSHVLQPRSPGREGAEEAVGCGAVQEPGAGETCQAVPQTRKQNSSLLQCLSVPSAKHYPVVEVEENRIVFLCT